MPDGEEGVGTQLAEIVRSLGQLQLTVLALIDLLRRPALHVSVEHMEVERFAFEIDHIDVDQLSGELNVGMTAQFKGAPPSQGRAVRVQAEDAGREPDRAAAVRTIWPPSAEGGEAKG